jgi:SAM-dependent methyltransferase
LDNRFFWTAARYVLNTVHLARRQQGWRSAVGTAAKLLVVEGPKIPRLVRLRWNRRGQPRKPPLEAPVLDFPLILKRLADFGIRVQTFHLTRDDFARHVLSFRYPRFYAGGSVATGGFRENKLLEYFLSLALLPVSSYDIVIDIGSERSLFPEMLRETTGARVLRQDLLYADGVRGDRIGGNAAALPLSANFADKLFLHNSFEHFERDADSGFVSEAWRVLKPGGGVCIIPLFLSARHQIVTDPLVDASNIVWDPEAEIVERIGYHNRFGRYYSVEMLVQRVLAPATRRGFEPRIHRLCEENTQPPDAVSQALRGTSFALVLQKP